MNDRRLRIRELGFAIGLAFAIIFAGCRPTMREVAQEFHPRIDQLEQELSDLSLAIPTDEDFNRIEKPLQPEIYFHVADGMSNTAVLSRKELLDGRFHHSRDDDFDLNSAFAFFAVLKNSYKLEPAKPRFKDELHASLNLNYIIAYDAIYYREAMPLAEGVSPGDKLEGFALEPLTVVVALYDRSQNTWLLKSTITIDPPTLDQLPHYRRTHGVRLDFEINDYFVEQTRTRIAELIEETAGGIVEFNDREFRQDGTQVEHWSGQNAM